jgi:hypothetical protein
MSTTCYANAQWAVGEETGVPAVIYVNSSYVLVDDSGTSLPSDNSSQLTAAFTPDTLDALRTQAEGVIQAQEPDTPGLTFVWLS